MLSFNWTMLVMQFDPSFISIDLPFVHRFDIKRIVLWKQEGLPLRRRLNSSAPLLLFDNDAPERRRTHPEQSSVCS